MPLKTKNIRVLVYSYNKMVCYIDNINKSLSVKKSEAVNLLKYWRANIFEVESFFWCYIIIKKLVFKSSILDYSVSLGFIFFNQQINFLEAIISIFFSSLFFINHTPNSELWKKCNWYFPDMYIEQKRQQILSYHRKCKYKSKHENHLWPI